MGMGVLRLPLPPSPGEPAWETQPAQLANTLSLFGLYPYDMVTQASPWESTSQTVF